MQAKREQWRGFAKTVQASHLVFLDESGVNIDMARRYGRGKGGRRVVDHAPLNTPQSTTILSSVRLDGGVAFTTFQGGTTGDKFLTYLKDVLIPTLHPGDIVVMDNLRTHHIQAVGELLHGAGAEVLYLPPYSPDLNPIEKLWSKVKAILRKLRVRSPDALDDAIHFALSGAAGDGTELPDDQGHCCSQHTKKRPAKCSKHLTGQRKMKEGQHQSRPPEPNCTTFSCGHAREKEKKCHKNRQNRPPQMRRYWPMTTSLIRLRPSTLACRAGKGAGQIGGFLEGADCKNVAGTV